VPIDERERGGESIPLLACTRCKCKLPPKYFAIHPDKESRGFRDQWCIYCHEEVATENVRAHREFTDFLDGPQ